MTSQRSTTPASRDATPELLTPRSKLRALLATVDGSDDEDAVPIGVLNTKSPKSSTAARDNADSSDSDSDVPVRPRGKLAGRMQGPSDITKEPETTNGVETARDRVRRMLEQEKEQAAEAMDTEMADAEDVEEEDELPAAPRRLKRRPAQDDATDLSARSPSPGLFVSSPVRPSPTKAPQNQPESEEDLPTVKSDRFKALVERKRQERLAREAEEEARRAERRALQEKLASELEQLDSGDDDGGITDDEGGRRLTQEARPTRKASKKALEDMNRETQRMARNMQLAHEAKTRKKLSKASLFERFNFRPDGEPMPVEPTANSSSRPVSPPTDADANKDTPPSSPPVGEKQDSVQVKDNAANPDPSVEVAEASSSTILDKGKGPAMDVEEPSKPAETKRRVRVRIPVPTKAAAADSDDELEITTTSKDRMNAVFNNIPFRKAQDSHSMLALRALAHVTSPGKENKRKNERDAMTPGEFQASLLQKAREQARSERDRRLELLKSQGVVIQTSEERERQMQEVEDILAKAREEAQRIKEEEVAAEKKEGKDGGEADPLAWDDSDDEEYEEDEAEDEDEDEDEDESEDIIAGSAMFEAEAEEDAASETSEVLPKPDANEMEGDDDDEGVEKVTPMKRRRARNKTAVLSDDEAEPAVEATPKLKRTPISTAFQSPAAPTSVLRSAKKTFIPGLPVEGPAGLSLTQIFAGTMDENQKSQDEPTQSMMPDFDDFPDSNFSATMDDNADDMVLDSQRDESQGVTQAIQLNLAQSQMHGLDSLLREEMNSQISDMVELSQDGGLQRYTPLKSRFVEPPNSTVETISTDQHGDAIQSSPLVRRGRLRRKMEMSSVDEDAAVPMSGEKGGEAEMTPTKTAFKVLQDAATEQKKKMLIEEFNKKKSKAKEMVEEQAEESEDEYAGLGGADGEDSDDEFDASLQDIIDDAAGNDEDARKLAAFYADRERINDEKEVEKLYKDITSGMLRRKRGADYDLSDSDDGGEARRRMKRRQFAKMQKALFADERVKKMAENPGNQAFLRTIEDRGSDDEMDFLEIVDAPASQGEESQSQSEQLEQQPPRIVLDSQPRKPLGSAGDNRAPAHMRRTKDGKKPSNIGEVRETLSDLLEDGRGSSVIPATVVGSDSEDEESRPASRGNKENQSPASRRTRNTVVDRISLKRNASSTLSSSNRPAFAAAGASSSSFKVPASLLRRATTNSSLLSTASTSSSSTTAAGGSGSGFGEEAKIKKGAGKKSGINGFSRDNEKLARMQENERRRQEKKVRGAESRAGLVGGLLGKGSFE
ncbi:MRC1-like domain-containing protein [Trichoderma breve]|uniref:MRC1-like domain-containing protein n=1 Tax=Trichoderma breve TaxID=2034170 RepID=A0A9W9ECD1_9HYPO|nr:MRC1-like domain-containing protein [Trichoderma breve]KAJ4864131.1 MRC1-like domain-containing protein [Trichoderma breve]